MLKGLSEVALTGLLVGGLVVSGCAKRAATAVPMVAPAPVTVGGGSGPAGTSGSGSTMQAPGTQGGPGGSDAAGSDRSQAAGGDRSQAGGGPGSRQPVRDFGVARELADVYFDFDQYEIRPADERVMERNARWLKTTRDLVLIEGHCDERGTSEYNVALAERRARSAMNYLVAQGIAANRITILSYGEERPQCAERSEACWSRNRRAHFLVKPQ
jgi:peptidoglycan-associated lipoprotein